MSVKRYIKVYLNCSCKNIDNNDIKIGTKIHTPAGDDEYTVVDLFRDLVVICKKVNNIEVELTIPRHFIHKVDCANG